MVLRWITIVIASAPAPALACGGFFCSGQVPIEQAGEQIVFGVEGTTVTAHIRVDYQGGAEDFSWVLPLPSVPTVAIGTDALFQTLQDLTAPTFSVKWTTYPDCLAACSPERDDSGTDACCSDDNSGSSGGTTGPPDSRESVSVLAEGDAGNYEYEVVEASSGDILFDWLNDNGYDQPETAREIVGHYVSLKFVFLAVRLKKDKDVGALPPIVLEYESPDLACVPLKLTSIGATNEMPVITYVLAKARAIPFNFFHAVPDVRAYPWLECASNGWWYSSGSKDCGKAWMDLVKAAGDLGNGRAFVTDFAGSNPYRESTWSTLAIDPPLAELRLMQQPLEYLDALRGEVPTSQVLQAIIREFIPMPAGLPDDCDNEVFYYSRFGWGDDPCLVRFPPAIPFDPVGMTSEIDERIVKPRAAADALLWKFPYLTRLAMTISPEEMTKDPMFSFNPDLEDVPRERNVRVTAECGNIGFHGFHFIYETGESAYFDHITAGCGIPRLSKPTGAVIEVMHEFGPPEVVLPARLGQMEAALDRRLPRPSQASVEQRRPSQQQEQSGASSETAGCTIGGTSPTVPLLIGLALAALRWRRRRS